MGFRATGPNYKIVKVGSGVRLTLQKTGRNSAVKVDRIRVINKGGTTAPRPFKDEGAFLYLLMK